ncbi:3-oxoacyl-[acyl-carrier protein] reductase [Rhodococcus sp. LBL1]|nr:3-oxoacyl-[acyl-carrier protein] reductase [Rhodococcus sp. LBL1]MDH6681408.1 3-oxoacyl-[acyl-carrier protein] reductase [Rhodococcus sp. LBL2]
MDGEVRESDVSDDFGIAGKTALVTGSGRNIGRAIVLELAGRGANVIVNARSNEAEAAGVAEEAEGLGARSLVVMGDAADKATVERMRTRAEEAFGGVDIYVSNAARRLYKDFFATTDEDWHAHLNQQLTASWYLAEAFVPGMRDRGWGRVVHINGEDGWLGGWSRIPHSVGKGGLRTLTKSLAHGLGQYGITVNDVSPGFVDTVRDMETHPEVTRERTEEFLQDIPIRRQPTPEELAWACAFLCSTRSGAITGAVIHVNGGQWMFG